MFSSTLSSSFLLAAAVTAEGEKPEEVKNEVKAEPAAPLSEKEEMMKKRVDRLVTILGGELSIELHLQFLIRNNKSDLLILKQTKDAIRVSVCHTATVIANAFMHSGTTSDQFLRYCTTIRFHRVQRDLLFISLQR